jgi:hypothetical protein
MLSFFNLFSQKPSFRINGEKRPNTVFGIIIGIITIPILFVGVVYILYDFFSHSNYTINSYIDTSSSPNIDLNDFKLGFLLVNPEGKPFPDHDRIYKINALYWDIYIPKFNEIETDINKIKNTTTNIIPSIRCDKYKNNTLHKQSFDLYSKKNNHIPICLDIPNLNKNLTGVYGNLGR